MQETLGLPVDSERERQRHARQAEADAKEAARLEAARVARDNRQERLMTAARALGSNGHEWLSAPNPKLGGSRPIEMAVSGEAELDRVLVEINREAHQREQTRRREETIAALRVGLVDEVTKILDDAAQPFLNSPYKELGNKRPIDYCRSDETYMACRTLAVKVKKQRRR